MFSIGCLHHTGDLAGAIREVGRVLRPGGIATIMVYNRDSLRQRIQRLRRPEAERVRASYDANSAGQAAPATEFTSSRELSTLLAEFSSYDVTIENFQDLTLRGRVVVPRRLLLGAAASRLGLDLYIVATR